MQKLGELLGKDFEVFAGMKNRDIKLSWFETKICYGIPVTNSILKDMGVIKNNACHICLTEMTQLFTLCANVDTPSPFGSGLRCV